MGRSRNQPWTRHHAGFVRGADHVSGDDDVVGEQQSWLQLRFRPVTHNKHFRAVGSRQEWGVRAELTEVGANLPRQLQALAFASFLSEGNITSYPEAMAARRTRAAAKVAGPSCRPMGPSRFDSDRSCDCENLIHRVGRVRYSGSTSDDTVLVVNSV